MPSKTGVQLDVVIVGAGLGGLAAAIGIQQAGHSVTVLEQAPRLGEVGAGIQIPPNSAKILERWGVKELIEPYCLLPESIYLRDYKEGKILSKQNLVPHTEQVYGGPYWHIHRADFHRVLVQAAEIAGVKILLNSEAESIDTNTNSVILSDGRKFTADVIVGADGVKSSTRQCLLQGEDICHNTGDLAYRIIIKTSEMKKHPELDFLVEKPNLNFWMGPDMHCAVYLLQDGKSCNIVIVAPDNLPADVLIQQADLEELRELFKDWDPVFQLLVSLCQSTAKWRLRNSSEMDTWVHPDSNFVLLGDACHATLPYLAQGAAQAVEDAAVLSQLLSKIETSDEVHDALLIYEKLRKRRTTRVVSGSTILGKEVFHLADGPEQEERDRLLAIEPPQKGCPNRWADPDFQKFLFGYDAYAEAELGWKKFKSS